MTPRRTRIKRILGRMVSSVTPKWVENHLGKKKRIRHALEALEKYPLNSKARQECAKALIELNGQLTREENAKRELAELPLSFRKENASLHQKELVQRLEREVEIESHEVRVRMWKLILELGKGDQNMGMRKAAEVIVAFNRSFNIPNAPTRT